MTRFLTAIAVIVLAACSGNSATDPSTGGGGSTGGGSTGGGTGENGGGNAGGAPAPLTAAVTVGNIFFKSAHNGSTNLAVDTIAVGGTVTWTWTNSGTTPHSVQSVGSPSFTSSDVLTGDGKTYQAQFSSPGTYQYDCAVHGTMMSGKIVVR